MPAWRETGDGLAVAIQLTPRGGRDALEGLETLADGRVILKARVRAAPTEGEANAALIALVARTLGLPRSRVCIAAGATARIKTVGVSGDKLELASRLGALFPSK